VPKDELDREIGNAFNRMRELNQKLNEPVEKLDQEALDAQAEMIDELMTLDFGLQPFRRAMSQRAKEDN
jgi:t-SNARE complex subunit (syntaxin)